MNSEQVVIRLKEKSYTVDAVFEFINDGDTTTEWIGFPNKDIYGPPLRSKSEVGFLFQIFYSVRLLG